MVGPPKVKPSKFFLFTEKFPCIENKEHFVDFAKHKCSELVLRICAPLHLLMIVYYQKVENEKIISQIVWVSEFCELNGDRVSKNDKSCNICSI